MPTRTRGSKPGLKALRDHRMSAEPAASDAREREAAAVAASHQGVFDLDLGTGDLTLSTEAAEILGLPAGASELNRDAWLARIHADDRAVYKQALNAWRHDPGLAFRLEFRARGLGGRTRCSSSCAPR